MTQIKHKRNVGRPSTFTPEVAAAICERIAQGESLRSITRDADMPAKTSVFEWLSQDTAFADQYARAREASADVYAEEIIEIADTDEDPQRARVRVDARKWVAAKLKPKRYGDSQTLRHADADGNKIQAIVNVTIAGT